MTAQTRATLYTYFATGAKPTAAQFANLVDSNLNIATTSGQAITSDVSALGKLDVTGNFSVNASALTALTGNVIVSGTTSISNTLSVTGSANSSLTGNLAVTGLTTLTGGLKGTTTNNSATALNVGEYTSSAIGFGGGGALTSTVATDVTSISLTAGDWDVWGSVGTDAAASTTTSQIQGWISTISATNPGDTNGGAYYNFSAPLTAGIHSMFPVGTKRISVASTTTVYLSIQPTFAVSTMTGWGFIGARRVR